jgi:hypothetical protein
MNEDDKNLGAGFYREFEELGERAVRRWLKSDDFPFGKRGMAADWLDIKAASRQRGRDWWARGLAIAALVVAVAMPLLNAWLFRGKR